MLSFDLEPCQVYDFANALGGNSLLTASVGPSGDAILLATPPEYMDIAQGNIPDEESARQTYPAAAIHAVDLNTIVSVDLPELTAVYPNIQPLSDGRILVVASRCSSLGDGGKKSATIYGVNGQVERQMVFGNGINSVQVSDKQQIWVAYYDVGIYESRFGREAVGHEGLICFDTEGGVVYGFEQPPGFESMSDCYALNVAHKGVWAYYYSQFPLVKILDDMRSTGWKNEIKGADAIATDGHRVLFCGSYGIRTSRCTLQTILGDSLVSPAEINLIVPDGDLSEARHVIGRDSILHVFLGTVWYQFDVRQIPNNGL